MEGFVSWNPPVSTEGQFPAPGTAAAHLPWAAAFVPRLRAAGAPAPADPGKPQDWKLLRP